jgi:hypothetical protein
VAGTSHGRQSQNSQNRDLLDTAGVIFHSESHRSIESQARACEDTARQELNRVAKLNRLSCPTEIISSEPDSPLTELSSELAEMTGENDESQARKHEKSLPATSSNDAPSLERGADEEDVAEFLEQFEDIVNKD